MHIMLIAQITPIPAMVKELWIELEVARVSKTFIQLNAPHENNTKCAKIHL